MKKFNLPLGAGITAAFDTPLHAIMGTSLLQTLAMAHVAEGAILKLDATTGEDLLARTGLTVDELAGPIAETFDPTGWYGTLDALRVAVGPFDRKSQAMNGILLALIGLDVSPARRPKAEEPKRNTDLEDLAASLKARGMPSEVADTVASDLLARFGDGITVLGVSAAAEEPQVLHRGAGFIIVEADRPD